MHQLPAIIACFAVIDDAGVGAGVGNIYPLRLEDFSVGELVRCQRI
jgi:hypothetical protein